jgi:hypothetical protein
VPAEDDRAGRDQLVEDLAEVGTQLVDAQVGDLGGVPGVGGRSPGGAAVPALVVADQPQLAVGDPRREEVGHVVPGRLGQGPAVREHEGGRRVVGSVDDGVQLRAIRRANGRDPAEDGGGAHAATSVRSLPAGMPT